MPFRCIRECFKFFVQRLACSGHAFHGAGDVFAHLYDNTYFISHSLTSRLTFLYFLHIIITNSFRFEGGYTVKNDEFVRFLIGATIFVWSLVIITSIIYFGVLGYRW